MTSLGQKELVAQFLLKPVGLLTNSYEMLPLILTSLFEIMVENKDDLIIFDSDFKIESKL